MHLCSRPDQAGIFLCVRKGKDIGCMVMGEQTMQKGVTGDTQKSYPVISPGVGNRRFIGRDLFCRD